MSNDNYQSLIENLSPERLDMELEILRRIRFTTDECAKEIRKKIYMIIKQKKKLESNNQ